jgi:hypothetical protein
MEQVRFQRTATSVAAASAHTTAITRTRSAWASVTGTTSTTVVDAADARFGATMDVLATEAVQDQSAKTNLSLSHPAFFYLQLLTRKHDTLLAGISLWCSRSLVFRPPTLLPSMLWLYSL